MRDHRDETIEVLERRRNELEDQLRDKTLMIDMLQKEESGAENKIKQLN